VARYSPAGTPYVSRSNTNESGDRQVPDELAAVAHQQGDPAQERALAPVRDEAEHARLAGGRVEEAREHLQGRGLAGAVGPQEADHLARLDRERTPSTAATARCWRRPGSGRWRAGQPAARDEEGPAQADGLDGRRGRHR